MVRREFVLLAKTVKPKDNIGGWYMSEKLDGTRCFWDGGVSRDVRTVDVPWANILDPKNPTQLKKKIKPVATGLWSRSGNPIIAPDWFLNKLPNIPLDGELHCGPGGFQKSRSIVAGDDPDPRWNEIEYAVYSCPPFDQVFSNGLIKTTQFVREISLDEASTLCRSKCYDQHLTACATFEEELVILRDAFMAGNVCLHKQTRLPKTNYWPVIEDALTSVVEAGGEGLMFRNPEKPWVPKRAGQLLKYKPIDDDESIIVGFTAGRETDKGSKLLGLIGNVITCYNGKRLELSGFTNEERSFETEEMTAHAAAHPGEIVPPAFQGKHFKVGETITFRYTDQSDDGIPKIARYWRKRDDS